MLYMLKSGYVKEVKAWAHAVLILPHRTLLPQPHSAEDEHGLINITVWRNISEGFWVALT